MIILYGFGAGFDLPEISPYVTKAEVQLKMAGLTYRKERSMPTASPKGQLPYIDDDGALVADSTFIRAHIERKYGIDLDAGLSARQRAEAWAIERMIENHLGWTMVYTRWLMPENFAKGPAHFFNAEQARREAQERVAGAARAVGIGRHSESEIIDLGTRSLAALSTLLADKPYLMGERPCGLDATAFGALAAILTPFFESELDRNAKRFETLTAYTARMMAQFYPDFAWKAA